MFNKKTKLKLTDFECNLLINGMNELLVRMLLIGGGAGVLWTPLRSRSTDRTGR